MADSFGSLVDKLATLNQKLFLTQDELYIVRRLSWEEYREKYVLDEVGAKHIYEIFKKAMDLNVQRSAVIKEVDSKLLEIIKAAINGEDLNNGSFVQDQHKTY